MSVIRLGDLPAVQRKQLKKKYPHQSGSLVIPDNLILLYSLLHDARDMF